MGDDIFVLTRALRCSKEILVCRLVEGKVSYVHQRLWPAVCRLQESLGKEDLGAIQEIHTSSGKHQVSVTPFPDWAPASAIEAAERLTVAEAASQLGDWFGASFEDR